MAAPLKTGLPPDLHLEAGYQLQLLALDPTTGVQVANVSLSDIAFFVTDVVGNPPQEGEDAEPLLVPLEDFI